DVQKLIVALVALAGEVVPFFDDLHLAYTHDLEPQLVSLAQRFGGVILGEAEAHTLDAMLEGTQSLLQHYIALEVPEPDVSTTARILSRWAADQKARGVVFSQPALDGA